MIRSFQQLSPNGTQAKMKSSVKTHWHYTKTIKVCVSGFESVLWSPAAQGPQYFFACYLLFLRCSFVSQLTLFIKLMIILDIVWSVYGISWLLCNMFINHVMPFWGIPTYQKTNSRSSAWLLNS